MDDPGDGCVIKTGNTVGETAFYICDEGFTLKGDRKHECQADGMWSGLAPTCDDDGMEPTSECKSHI